MKMYDGSYLQRRSQLPSTKCSLCWCETTFAWPVEVSEPSITPWFGVTHGSPLPHYSLHAYLNIDPRSNIFEKCLLVICDSNFTGSSLKGIKNLI